MCPRKNELAVLIFLAATFLGSGASAGENVEQTPKAAENPPPRLDLYGDPLPQGAIARMGTIQFHQPTAGKEKLFLSEVVIPAAFSPDGRVIATHWGMRLRLWSARNGKLLIEIATSDLIWSETAFSSDSRYIAAALSHETPDKRDTYVCIWDVKTGKLRNRLAAENGLKAYVRHVVFSPDGKLLAATDEPHEKGAIHVWSLETGKEVAVLSSKSAKITSYACLAFSADGKTLVAMPHQSSQLWHWDIAKGEDIKHVPLEGIFDVGNPPTPRNVGIPNMYDWHFSKDGQILACRFDGDRMVRLVDTATGKTLRRFQQPALDSIVAFTGKDRLLATAEYKDRPEYKIVVSLSDTKTGELKRQFKFPRQSGHMVFSPDGSRMIFASSKVRLYDVASGNELLRKPTHEGSAASLVFTPDGSTLISGSTDGTIGIWDAATGKSRHFIRVGSWATGVALVPGGSTFVSCGLDGLIRIHDWRTGKEIRRFGFAPIAQQQFQDLRISDDGKTVISQVHTGNDDKKPPFHSWDLATGKLLKSFPKQGNAEFTGLSNDGKRVIGVRFQTPRHLNYTVELRDIADGRLLFTRDGAHSGGGLVDLLIAKDRLLIHGDSDDGRTIRLREMATGKDRLSIVSKNEGPEGCFERIALSPDGRILAAAEHAGSLQLWDLLAGKELMRRSGYDDPVHTMTFSSNSKFLATAHADGTILVWDVLAPQRKPSQVARSAKEFDSWWKDLAGEDATKAHVAIRDLVESPKETVALLEGRLRPAADKRERISKLLAQLDADTFTAREAASNELKMYSCQAVPSMQRVLKQKISLEERLRIELILDRPALRVHSAELLRGIRAVEVLEYIAASGADSAHLAAMELLKKIAGGAPEAPLTREAKAALRRSRR